MRKSRVLLAGVAVAAAGVATSAYTASNTYTLDNNVAGYGEVTVSGATITNIAYAADTDASKLATVTFTASNDIASTTATMMLKLGAVEATGQANSCTVNGGTDTILCTLTAPVPFVNFNNLALTVTSN
jgi:hypothetical protein